MQFDRHSFELLLEVGFGSKGEYSLRTDVFCFGPNNGQSLTRVGMSVLCQIAT
jgi:hypothetical protein